MMNGWGAPSRSPGWREAAEQAAANLGFGSDLAKLFAEHWQKVLASVEVRIRLKRGEMPDDWRNQFARLVGRTVS